MFVEFWWELLHVQGRIQDFKLGGAHFNFLGVFRVKNHDFTTGHRHPPGSTPSFPRYYIFMRAERPILLRFF